MRARARCLVGATAATCLCASPLASTVSVEPGSYELTAETVLPHLEENLRYATTRSRQCLGTQDATALFPLLRHPAFAGCALEHRAVSGSDVRFSLRCLNPQAASGDARFTLEPGSFHAVLDIKMGGKNMTLSQRLGAHRLGACASE